MDAYFGCWYILTMLNAAIMNKTMYKILNMVYFSFFFFFSFLSLLLLWGKVSRSSSFPQTQYVATSGLEFPEEELLLTAGPYGKCDETFISAILLS